MNITSFGRLHFGLVDTSGATARMFGGIGCAVDLPVAQVEARPSAGLELRSECVESQCQERIHSAVSRLLGQFPRLRGRVTVLQTANSHVGLGATTSVVLAVTEALAVVNELQLSQADLVRFSGRGGTSGVGTSTYFSGGFVADAGRRRVSADEQYLPSLATADALPTGHVGRWDAPDGWEVMAFFTDATSTIEPNHEQQFFQDNTPTEKHATLQQLATVYHGIIPAIIDKDLELFGVSLQAFQALGFKSREISAQPGRVVDSLQRLWSTGVTAGLSSLGPCVFAIGTPEVLTQAALVLPTEASIRVKLRNSGREVSQ